MGRHELNKERVSINVSELVREDEPVAKELQLINAVIVLANAALSQYGIELVTLEVERRQSNVHHRVDNRVRSTAQ